MICGRPGWTRTNGVSALFKLRHRFTVCYNRLSVTDLYTIYAFYPRVVEEEGLEPPDAYLSSNGFTGRDATNYVVFLHMLLHLCAWCKRGDLNSTFCRVISTVPNHLGTLAYWHPCRDFNPFSFPLYPLSRTGRCTRFLGS